MARIAREPEIRLATGAAVRDAALHAHGVSVSVETAAGLQLVAGRLLVGADGVWSTLRELGGQVRKSRFAGELAWRRTVPAESPPGLALAEMGAAGMVTAFLSPGFHMVAYPVRGGSAFNLAAFTPGPTMTESWSGRADAATLRQAMQNTALAPLAQDGEAWTAWPIHTVDGRPSLDRARARADRRRRACDDALCGAGCGDGDRGCGDAGRLCRGAAGGPRRRTRPMGGRAATTHCPRRAQRRAQPSRLARLGAGGACPQSVSENAFGRKTRCRPRLALWVGAWADEASIEASSLTHDRRL